MFRISMSCLFCAALALVFVTGCGSTQTTTPATEEVLLFETDEIIIFPDTTKDVKVKTGKVESAEAPEGSGVTAKVADGKVTISAAKDAKVNTTHEVKVKGGKKDATIKVKVMPKADE
jgi:hypothetical protein